MPRIGITGHRRLDEATAAVVSKALHEALTSYDPADLVGVSCIADGADSLFARAVLDCGGRIELVIPAAQYRDDLPTMHHAAYDRLLARATATHRLDFDESTPEAHMAASKQLLSLVEELFAVWDGQPARGHGGTADVVAEARERSIPVHVIWPKGARRD